MRVGFVIGGIPSPGPPRGTPAPAGGAAPPPFSLRPRAAVTPRSRGRAVLPPACRPPHRRATAPVCERRRLQRPPRRMGPAARRQRLVRALPDAGPRRPDLARAARGGTGARGAAADPDDRPPARDRDDLGPPPLRAGDPAGAHARTRSRRLRGARRRRPGAAGRLPRRAPPPGGAPARP